VKAAGGAALLSIPWHAARSPRIDNTSTSKSGTEVLAMESLQPFAAAIALAGLASGLVPWWAG